MQVYRPGWGTTADSGIDAELLDCSNSPQCRSGGWSCDEIAIALHNIALADVASKWANEAINAQLQSLWRWAAR